MVVLNDIIDPASGWDLMWARGINDNHDVVGMGALNGEFRAFKMHLPDLSPCPAPSCHVAGVRDLATGQCPSPPELADGTACNDGDACTLVDTCHAGVCSDRGQPLCAVTPIAEGWVRASGG